MGQPKIRQFDFGGGKYELSDVLGMSGVRVVYIEKKTVETPADAMDEDDLVPFAFPR